MEDFALEVNAAQARKLYDPLPVAELELLPRSVAACSNADVAVAVAAVEAAVVDPGVMELLSA
jgi:hypothetical protein